MKWITELVKGIHEVNEKIHEESKAVIGSGSVMNESY